MPTTLAPVLDFRVDHASLALATMRQGVAHQVHAAALPTRLEHLAPGRLGALVAVADDEFDAQQASPREAAQELAPKCLGARWRRPSCTALDAGRWW